MQEKRFQKRKENFICLNCGVENKGTGYTNHCFNCLYSKHIDIFPGDRQNSCCSLMKIIDYNTTKKHEYTLTFQCLKCKKKVNDKLRKEDDFSNFLKIVKEINKKKEI